MKLYKSLSLIAALTISQCYGMEESFEGAPTAISIRYKKNNFGDVILNSQDIDPELPTQLYNCVESLKKLHTETAFITYLPHEEGHKIQYLIKSGFVPRYIDTQHTEWIIKNGTSIPDTSTAVAGARVLVCRNDHVLMIEDKRFKGQAVYPGGGVDAGELALDAACREIKEEVGLTIQPSDLRLIALINHLRSNRYGYTDYCHYYMTRKFTGEVKIQESEILQAFWAPLSNAAQDKADAWISPASFSNAPTVKGLTISPTVKILAAHIIRNGPTATHRVLDPRQYIKPAAEQDPNDTMDINLFHISDNETKQ